MKKFLSLLLCAVFAFACALPSAANYTGEAESIIAYKTAQSGAKNTAEWAEKLAHRAGNGAEWYVLALSALGAEADFGTYAQALADYLGKRTLNATNAQRCALAFLVAGIRSAYIDQTAENTIGSMGIMSYIWGLILLNNGAKSTKFTPEALAEKIASMRLADGGFALSGTVSNVDVTAMALAALAPHRQNTAVNEAVESALTFLSSAQTERGGFVNYGTENCESAAQVIIALTALGIDPETDARFIKNGNSAFDSMRSFALAGGGYAHTQGGAESDMASAQALQAFVAIERFKEGKTPLFEFGIQTDRTPTGFRDVGDMQNEAQTPPKTDTNKIKTVVCIAVIAACAIGISVVALLPKKKKD
ncbi:MAG: terpene cyclase/mutase family protein [Clostridia bacterium]|nr:terpene cyclase/mutase family protein [Clostridia bacterium]